MNSTQNPSQITITGLFETHLKVRNLERAITFYRDVLGLELGYHESARGLALFWIGERGQAMLGLWQVPEAEFVTSHFAFTIPLEQMYGVCTALERQGIAWRNFLNDDSGSLYVHAWMPAVSVYFADPDGHSLEFLAMLPDPPQLERGLVLWEEWEVLHARGFPQHP
jgi:lactoylglutathione lyase